MLAPGARRQIEFRLIGKDQEPDLVVVADGAEREKRGGFDHLFALVLLPCPEKPGGGGIHGKHHRKLAFLAVFLDERRAHARGHVPVDVADVILRSIFPDFAELDSAPLEHAVIRAPGDLVHKTAGLDLYFFYF